LRQATIFLIALLGAISLACRPPVTVSAGTAHVALAPIRTLAREGTPDFSLADALDHGGAISLGTDRVALLDFELARIVVIDSTGRIVARFGRHGGGPGEIQLPRFLVRTRAGLGVVDDQKYALVQFTLDGRTAPELPLQSLIGIPRGILTGISELGDGSWVYSVREPGELTSREALYRRMNGASRELASTPVTPGRPIRLPCGITLSPAPPVFWPTLRWTATPTQVAWAATAEDRVTVWDAERGDSTVVTDGVAPVPATAAAALDAIAPLTVQLGGNGCVLTREGALRQRGMQPVVPAIERLALSPAGELWIRSPSVPGAARTRIHSGVEVDTLVVEPFPILFLSGDRFLTATVDSVGALAAETWEVRRQQ
jgi:hypothetical protein